MEHSLFNIEIDQHNNVYLITSCDNCGALIKKKVDEPTPGTVAYCPCGNSLRVTDQDSSFLNRELANMQSLRELLDE